MKFIARKGIGTGAVLAGLLGTVAVGMVGYRTVTGDCLLGGCSGEAKSSCYAEAENPKVDVVSFTEAGDESCALGCGGCSSEVTTVANTEEPESCETSCSTSCDEAKVTEVANKTDECAKACSSACGEAKMTEVANKTDECAKACSSACGEAKMTEVANKTDECAKACSSACGEAKMTEVSNKTDCASKCGSSCDKMTTAITTVAASDDCKKTCAGEMKEGCCGACPGLDKNKAAVTEVAEKTACASACSSACGEAKMTTVAEKASCASACDAPCSMPTSIFASLKNSQCYVEKTNIMLTSFRVENFSSKCSMPKAEDCSAPCGSSCDKAAVIKTSTETKSECSKSCGEACPMATAANNQ